MLHLDILRHRGIEPHVSRFEDRCATVTLVSCQCSGSVRIDLAFAQIRRLRHNPAYVRRQHREAHRGSYGAGSRNRTGVAWLGTKHSTIELYLHSSQSG